MSVSSDTTCTDVGAAASDFLLDFMSEWGDCNKIDSMTLNEKAQLCSRLKESLCFVQKSSLEQEKVEAIERAHELFNKCDVCKLVFDSRQRKQAEIRQLYLQVLDKKPAELLCTPGIFSRLETMASKGLFDAVVAEGQRCSKCRQVIANQILLTSEVVDVLQQEFGNSGHCCMERACSKCLRFVVTSLGHQVAPEEGTDINEEIPKSTTNKNRLGQDYLKEMAENMKLMREEMKTVNKDQMKCQMSNFSVQQEAQNKSLLCLQVISENLSLHQENQNKSLSAQQEVQNKSLFCLQVISENLSLFQENQFKSLSAQQEVQMENLSCLQNMNERLTGLQNICQKLDLLQAEFKNSSSLTLVDKNIRIPLNLPSFSGEAWESPRLAIRMWQENLKKSGTVKEEWRGLVCEALEGKAKDWCTEQDLTDTTWEQFAQLFLDHFDRDMKRVVNEYIKSVLANDEGEVLYNHYYSKSNSNGQTFHRTRQDGKLFNFCWMERIDIERFLLACLRALDDNLKHLLSLFNAQFNDLDVPKLNPVTTFTELIIVLQKHAPDNYQVDSIKYYKEMKSVANTVIENTCSASFMLDQLNF